MDTEYQNFEKTTSYWDSLFGDTSGVNGTLEKACHPYIVYDMKKVHGEDRPMKFN
jgi:hypothetical protein